jgi:hypothetical protein
LDLANTGREALQIGVVGRDHSNKLAHEEEGMQLFSMQPGLSVPPIVYAPVLSGAVLMFKACEPLPSKGMDSAATILGLGFTILGGSHMLQTMAFNLVLEIETCYCHSIKSPFAYISSASSRESENFRGLINDIVLLKAS